MTLKSSAVLDISEQVELSCLTSKTELEDTGVNGDSDRELSVGVEVAHGGGGEVGESVRETSVFTL